MLSCAKRQSDLRNDLRTSQRIHEVENGLVAFRPDAPMAVPDSSMERHALADRMAFHKVPGVSASP